VGDWDFVISGKKKELAELNEKFERHGDSMTAAEPPRRRSPDWEREPRIQGGNSAVWERRPDGPARTPPTPFPRPGRMSNRP